MRFAFYGRVSTEDQQDPASTRNWQLARSRQVIEPDGEIVEEFFDIGQSRSLPWKRRPEASRLLDTFRDPDRGFDAVVIGEPQRAFYGNQFGLTFPALRSCGGCERVGGGPRLRARGPGESVVLTPIEPPEPSWRQTLRACARCLSACVT